MSHTNSKLAQYLKQFISDKRKKLFEKKIKERTKQITIVLEDVFQRRNISASIRSADCFGIQDVHIIENTNTFTDDPEVSMGAEKWITTKRYRHKKHNSAQTIKHLQAKGYQVIATTPHDTDCNLFELNFNKHKIALIFGNEIRGCSKEALELADKKINIPMYGFTESFNLSVSVSLCLQHLTYKLRNSSINWQMSKKEKNEIILQWLRNSIKSSSDIEKKYLQNNE